MNRDVVSSHVVCELCNILMAYMRTQCDSDMMSLIDDMYMDVIKQLVLSECECRLVSNGLFLVLVSGFWSSLCWFCHT